MTLNAMKTKFLLGTSFLALTPCLGLAGGAEAASPPVYNWSGPYLGGSVGFGWGRSNQTDTGVPTAGSGSGGGGGGGIVTGSGSGAPTLDGHYTVNGGLVGGSLGFNWQRDGLVYGLDGDYSFADVKGASDVCGTGPIPLHPCGTRLDSFGTLRGKAGYTIGTGGNWLLYGTGGLALGTTHAWDNLMPASGSRYRAGWTAGGGIEAALSRGWSARLEYLYIDLGKTQNFDAAPGIPENVSFNSSIIRLGVSYHLGGGGVAKK